MDALKVMSCPSVGDILKLVWDVCIPAKQDLAALLGQQSSSRSVTSRLKMSGMPRFVSDAPFISCTPFRQEQAETARWLDWYQTKFLLAVLANNSGVEALAVSIRAVVVQLLVQINIKGVDGVLCILERSIPRFHGKPLSLSLTFNQYHCINTRSGPFLPPRAVIK